MNSWKSYSQCKMDSLHDYLFEKKITHLFSSAKKDVLSQVSGKHEW
jgi:hypothetical protein